MIFFQVLNDLARFMNDRFNNHEVMVIRMADTWNTKPDRLVEYLRNAFPGTGSKTGINDYYSRKGTWPTIQQAIDENKRVFITAQDKLCNRECRKRHRFFIPVSELLFSF